MTELSDTPAQQLARIARLEEDAGRATRSVWRDDVRWLCALARQGVEARQSVDLRSKETWDDGYDQGYREGRGEEVSRPQSPEGTP